MSTLLPTEAEAKPQAATPTAPAAQSAADGDESAYEIAQVAAAWLARSSDREAARRAALNHLIGA